MDIFMALMLGYSIGSYVKSSNDITNYFNKPYCEEVKLGASKVKKCWKVVEVKE